MIAGIVGKNLIFSFNLPGALVHYVRIQMDTYADRAHSNVDEAARAVSWE